MSGIIVGMGKQDFNWRLRYAPNGYHFLRQRITFETLERAWSSRELIALTVERMEQKVYLAAREDCAAFSPHTFISVYPKHVGENLNCLDPLVPRFGVEIEVRLPALRSAVAA